MAVLNWDAVGQRYYETGVDRGVLYLPDESGAYVNGYAWNGLETVTESPEGAEVTETYADNILYLNLISVERFKGTIEAYTYPNEFAECDGSVEVETGVFVGQQPRKTFGMSYRTRLGNDLEKEEYGYKLHLVYNALAAPSEKAFSTINDSPEAVSFSWEFSTTPAPVTGQKPTSLITIDSTKVGSADLTELEQFLYGTAGTDPSLPSPDAVIAIFAGALTTATPTAPTYNSTTDIMTIPSVTGVEYRIGGVVVPSGSYGPITENTLVTANPLPGYKFPTPTDDDWLITFA